MSNSIYPEMMRDVLRTHHPIMRSETGPLSGCRCGQVGLGQDVIAHVVDQLLAVYHCDDPSASPSPLAEEATP